MISQSQKPLVTIMIPTYNQAKDLARAVKSAQAQSYTNLEILVSDDNSTDSTPEVMRSFESDPRVKYIRHLKNLGRVGNYRKMIYELASGEWLLNVDGDDFLTDSTFIENAIQVAREKQDVVLVFARQKYMDAQTHTESLHSEPNVPPFMSGLDLFFDYPFIQEGMPHIGSLYRRDVAMKANVQSEDIITSDSESLLRIIVHGKVAYLNQIVGCWVGHQANESGKLNFEKRWSSLRMALGPAEYLKSLRIAPDEKVENWKTAMLSRLIRENLSLYLERTDRNGFLKFAQAAYQEFPTATLKAFSSKAVLMRLLIPGFSKLKPLIKSLLRKTNAGH